MGKKKKKKLRTQAVPDAGKNINPEKRSVPPSKKISDKTQLRFFSKKFLSLSSILVLLVIILYSSSFNHGYTYDDAAVVSQNRYVQKGFAGIGDILRSQYFEGYDAHTNAMAYRPVSLISYAVEYELFGQDAQPHHAISIILYALTGILLFLTLHRLLKGYHYSLPFIIALLFVAHPIHTEVVTNIKSRDELLGFFNFLVSLIFLLKYLDKPSTGKLIFSLLFYFLALASKESLLPTLAVIPLLLYFFRDLAWKKILRLSIPYVIVFIVFLLIRRSVIGTEHGASPIEYLDNPLLAASDLNTRVGSNILVMGMYLQSLIFPYKLACDYSYNSIPLVGLADPQVIAYIIAYLLLIFLAIKGFRKKTIWSFCILYFFVTISIVSSILILSSNAYADRFLYTPSLSICMAIGFLLYRLPDLKTVQLNKNFFSFSGKNLLPLVILALLLGLSFYKTAEYIPAWKNDLALFSYNVKINPLNARMLKNLGSEYVTEAVASTDTAKQKELVKKGIPFLEKGLSIYSRQSTGWTQLGNAYFILKDYAKAEEKLRKALEIDTADRFAIGSLGSILYMTGRYQQAADEWEKIDPAARNSNDNYNLYLAYRILGNNEKADYYKKLSGR